MTNSQVRPGIKSLLLCAAMALGGMSSQAQAQEALRIGAINPFSGPLALYGDEMARGYQLAIDERNAKGGVLGRKIELLKGDASTPQQGIAAVDQLVSRDKAELFIGTYISAVSNAASTASQAEAEIAMLMPEACTQRAPRIRSSGSCAGRIRLAAEPARR